MNPIALSILISLLLSAAASAQVNVPLRITSEEEARVYSALTRGSLRKPAPAGAKLAIGTRVPIAVPLDDVPDTVPAPIRGYRYTVHSDRVYIVDPSTRKVVRVIPNR